MVKNNLNIVKKTNKNKLTVQGQTLILNAKQSEHINGGLSLRSFRYIDYNSNLYDFFHCRLPYSQILISNI